MKFQRSIEDFLMFQFHFVFKSELWIAKWKRKAVETKEKDVSCCLLNAMEECDKDMYSSSQKFRQYAFFNIMIKVGFYLFSKCIKMNEPTSYSI